MGNKSSYSPTILLFGYQDIYPIVSCTTEANRGFIVSHRNSTSSLFLSGAWTVLYYTHMYHIVDQLLLSGFWPTRNFCSYLFRVHLPNSSCRTCISLPEGFLWLLGLLCLFPQCGGLQSVGGDIMLTREQPSTNDSWESRCKGGKTQVCSMQFPSRNKPWLPQW